MCDDFWCICGYTGTCTQPLANTPTRAFLRTNTKQIINSPHDNIESGQIGLNALQRRTANLALNTPIPVFPFQEKAGNITMVALNLTADLMVKGKGKPKQVRVCAGRGCVGLFWCVVVVVVLLQQWCSG